MKLGDKAEQAAKIDRRTRMEMIQRGYNPMDSQDVANWFANKPSTGLMAQLVTAGAEEGMRLNNMGEKGMNINSDMMAIKQAVAEGDHNIDMRHLQESPESAAFMEEVTKVNWDGPEGRQDVNEPGGMNQASDIKRQLANQIDYTPKTNVNDRVRNIIGEQPNQQQQPNQPIRVPKKIEEKSYITETAKAINLGYVNGCGYLNAFIRQLKEPTSEGRIKLIEAMNKMVIAEDTVHPNILAEYRKGIVKSEKELYAKIKNQNKPK